MNRMVVDSGLVRRVQLAATGANIHKVASDLQHYYFAIEVYNHQVREGNAEEAAKQLNVVNQLKQRLEALVVAKKMGVRAA